LTIPIINIIGPQIMPGVQQPTNECSENLLHPDDEDNDGSHVGFFKPFNHLVQHAAKEFYFISVKPSNCIPIINLILSNS
jgi:hypothetical protein